MTPSMENKLVAIYDQDSKRYHRFKIDESQGLTGTIYVSKDKPVPDTVTIFLKTKTVVGEGK